MTAQVIPFPRLSGAVVDEVQELAADISARLGAADEAYEQGVTDCLAALDQLDGSKLTRVFEMGREYERRVQGLTG